MPYYVTSAEGSNFRLALYARDGGFSVVPDNSLLWAQNHKRADYVPLDRKEGFVGYIVPGSLALTYDKAPDELRDMPSIEIKKRLYKIVKFRSDGLVTFRYHAEARAAVDLGKDLVAIGKHKAGESAIDFENPHELMLLSPVRYCGHMLFEGIHFRMMLDGSIRFL